MGVFNGMFSFVLFYLYDLVKAMKKKKILNHLFFIGCFLLIIVIFILLYEHYHFINWNLYQLFILTFAMIGCGGKYNE